jgi:hypothetical protein
MNHQIQSCRILKRKLKGKGKGKGKGKVHPTIGNESPGGGDEVEVQLYSYFTFSAR